MSAYPNRSRSGFSLAEILVAVTISAFLLTSAYAVIISLASGSESLVNYSEMNSQSRSSIEVFGRDARAAKDIHTFTDTTCTVLREVWDNDSKNYVDRFLTYEYLPSAGTFSRIMNQVTITKGKRVPGAEVSRQILIYDVEELNFSYFRLHDPEIPDYDPVARSKLEVKHVQLEARIQRRVLRLVNTNYIISARFMMRNKNVGE
ncbi:MAG: PulJ/GspJ family protein [Opitutales bacterium]|jgi:prepilin-type N-terminal cleavage/methylation domain-containing protein